jgi:hypothetical protein
MAIAPSNAGVRHSSSEKDISSSPKDKYQVDVTNVVKHDKAVVLCSIAILGVCSPLPLLSVSAKLFEVDRKLCLKRKHPN